MGPFAVLSTSNPRRLTTGSDCRSTAFSGLRIRRSTARRYSLISRRTAGRRTTGRCTRPSARSLAHCAVSAFPRWSNASRWRGRTSTSTRRRPDPSRSYCEVSVHHLPTSTAFKQNTFSKTVRDTFSKIDRIYLCLSGCSLAPYVVHMQAKNSCSCCAVDYIYFTHWTDSQASCAVRNMITSRLRYIHRLYSLLLNTLHSFTQKHCIKKYKMHSLTTVYEYIDFL